MDRRASSTIVIALLAGGSSGCILRPGMNSDCVWPSEKRRTLNLQEPADREHLVLDAELIEELVDRYRFHPAAEQRACEDRLRAAVAAIHSVQAMDMASASADVSNRGLDLPVRLPVGGLFILSVAFVVRRVERRFTGEALPLALGLIAASILLPGLFLWIGEFWTSVLQMIRVGSHHVGGRVDRLPWLQHQPQSFVVGVGLFWVIALVRWARGRRGRIAETRTIHKGWQA